jgi:hypothetical protein
MDANREYYYYAILSRHEQTIQNEIWSMCLAAKSETGGIVTPQPVLKDPFEVLDDGSRD